MGQAPTPGSAVASDRSPRPRPCIRRKGSSRDRRSGARAARPAPDGRCSAAAGAAMRRNGSSSVPSAAAVCWPPGAAFAVTEPADAGGGGPCWGPAGVPGDPVPVDEARPAASPCGGPATGGRPAGAPFVTSAEAPFAVACPVVGPPGAPPAGPAPGDPAPGGPFGAGPEAAFVAACPVAATPGARRTIPSGPLGAGRSGAGRPVRREPRRAGFPDSARAGPVGGPLASDFKDANCRSHPLRRDGPCPAGPPGAP